MMFVIALLIYVAHIFYDYKNQESFMITGWRQQEFALAKQEESDKLYLTALLLGGSNVAYSLSAQNLNNTTSYNWYNFGLGGEARTDLNYWNYISETLDLDQRKQIELIVYSSVALLRSEYLEKRRLETANAWGQRPLGIRPNKPLYKKIEDFNSKRQSSRGYPLPIAMGDFNFSRKKCPQKYQQAFDREENLLVAEAWISSQINEINLLFPNAKIIFVLPSEFYGKSYKREIALSYNDFVNSVITKNLSNKVIAYFPSPFPNKDITCDGRHHGNIEGRNWRTNNLFKFIKENNM